MADSNLVCEPNINLIAGTFQHWFWGFIGASCSFPAFFKPLILIAAQSIIYATAAIGAAIPYLFYSNNSDENKGLIGRLKILFPGKSNSFYPLLEFVITVFFGGFAGMILAEPNTIREAFISGLGWFGLVTGISSSSEKG